MATRQRYAWCQQMSKLNDMLIEMEEDGIEVYSHDGHPIKWLDKYIRRPLPGSGDDKLQPTQERTPPSGDDDNNTGEQ